jgi:hypothetical protein
MFSSSTSNGTQHDFQTIKVSKSLHPKRTRKKKKKRSSLHLNFKRLENPTTAHLSSPWFDQQSLILRFNKKKIVQKSGEAVMAWNVFKFCTALRALGSIMIVLVLGIIGVTYYVIVVANYGPALFHGGLDSFVALLVLVLFHSLVSYSFLFFFFLKV